MFHSSSVPFAPLPPFLSRRRALQTLFCSSAAWGLNVTSGEAALESKIEPGDRHILLLGDYGSMEKAQDSVARGMQRYINKEKIKPEGLWLLGDNFYKNLDKGVDSSRWKSGFENLYPDHDLPGPCWAILGNHDYHDTLDGDLVQLAYKKKNPKSRWHMPDRYYRVDWPEEKPLVTFLAVDTNWKEINQQLHKALSPAQSSWWMSQEERDNQTAWLDAEFSKPRVAPFLFVMGHHPLYTNGPHGDTKPLINELGPLFQEHGVDFYCCGHDHDLQHLELEGLNTSFIVSGAGGARITDIKDRHDGPFAKSVYGFSHLQINRQRVLLRHLDANGTVVHSLTRSAEGKVAVG
jgi:tartrate-resistant acid phosphatase type 5